MEKVETRERTQSIAEDAVVTPSTSHDTLNTRQPVPFEMRSIPVPSRRIKSLKEAWMKIYAPIVNQCRLQIRMNLAERVINIRTCPETLSPAAIQRGEEFLRAVTYGFAVEDALSVLRMDSVYVDCFEIEDVRMLRHGHIGRAVGRIAGTGGKIKRNLEQASQTRIVLEDKNIRVLGTFDNIQLVRTAVSRLIMGAQPSKVCSDLINAAKRRNI